MPHSTSPMVSSMSSQDSGIIVYDKVEDWTTTTSSVMTPNALCSPPPTHRDSYDDVGEGKEQGDPSVRVFAVLPDTDIRLVVQANSFPAFCAAVTEHTKPDVIDAFLHILDARGDEMRVSARGDGWRLVRSTYDLEVVFAPARPRAALDPSTISHVCWNVCARHKAPLKWTPAIINDVLGPLGSFRRAFISAGQGERCAGNGMA